MRMGIILTFLIAINTFAQNEVSSGPKIFVGPREQIELPPKAIFKGQSRSLIPWAELKPFEYTNYRLWKKSLKLKEKYPNWQRNFVEKSLEETIGRVIECKGDCRLYRGLGFSKAQYKTRIQEGDEFVTLKGGYSWIYLFDGTLIRVSPETSISFKEINIGLKENFVHARINSGNVFWLPRYQNKYKSQQFRETDPLFFPLSLFEANPKISRVEVDEGNLFSILEDDFANKKKSERLNNLIEDNNESIFKKPTVYFWVLPNGNLIGRDVATEFIVLQGKESYFKVRDERQLGFLGELPERAADFFFRGYENERSESVEFGVWHKVDAEGRDLRTEIPQQSFKIGEFLTKYIPTFLIARELMAQKYSSFAHTVEEKRNLALLHGYRMWGDLEDKKSDLFRRIRFLKEYTRRAETTNLLIAKKFREKLKKRGDEVLDLEHGPRFFSKAVARYYSFKETQKLPAGQDESLNSTRKSFWKKIHGIRE